MSAARSTLPARALRIAAALAIVAWLASRSGLDTLGALYARVDPALLLGALGFMFADSLFKAWNWRRLIASLVTDRDVPMRRVLSWYFAGGFLGAVLPSSASTDAIRAWLSQRSLGGHGAACAASVLTLNGVGWMAGSVLGLTGIALLALGRRLPELLNAAAVLFTGMAIVLPVGYRLLTVRHGRISRFLADLRWPRIGQAIRRFLDAVCVFERAHVRFLQFLVIAGTGMLAQAGMYAMTAASVGIYLPFAVWLMLALLTRIIALVPMSVMDFGLIQGAHVAVLALLGVPPSTAFVMSTLFALQGAFIHATVGSFAFVSGGSAVPAPARAGR